MPQRVLQQRPKNVVEAGEESRVRRGLPGPLHRYAPAYQQKRQSTGTACVFSVAEAVAGAVDRVRIVYVMEIL